MRRILTAAAGTSALIGAGDAVAQESPTSPRVETSQVLRATETTSGQALVTIAAPYEVVVSRTTIPAGGALPMHKHPWPRYGYVLSGRIRVTYEATGQVREFGAGEALIEAIDEWHEGRAVGDQPAHLIAFDQVPPSQSNVVRR